MDRPQRRARRAVPDLAAALAPFVALAGSVLPPDRRDAMIAAACLIAPWTVHPDGENVGGALCADGTPLEASLAFDRHGDIELRLVGDVGAGIAAHDPHERRRQVAERCARLAGPGEAGAQVGDLAARHLEGRPPGARALAFVGVGASATRPFHRMFYFSFEGLLPAAAQALMAQHLEPALVARLWSMAGVAAGRVQGVGYDLDGECVTKVQLYARMAIGARQDFRELLAPCGEADLAACADLMSAMLLPPRARSAHHLVGLGVAKDGGAATRIAPRLYAPLAAHGIDRFAALGPAWSALASRWRAPVPEVIGLASACTPTMLSASSTSGSERCAIYFSIGGPARSG